jgi:uncharacterized protein (TIGR02145 family)
MKKKLNTLWFRLLVTGIIIVFINSCKKDKPVGLPELSTTPLSSVNSTSALCGGSVTSDGGAMITARGVCWDIEPKPDLTDNITSDGTGAGGFLSSITGLSVGTPYYVRAYATNIVGTSYGNEFLFVPPLTDIDGNNYNVQLIGNQIWMAENLRTTKLNDNTLIPMISVNTAWVALSTAAYCWFRNDQDYNKSNYGALYNWFAVNSGKLCPEGWHVPNDNEWITLTEKLGGPEVAGGKLKESGLGHWSTPNTGATDESGFNARPGGYRGGNSSGAFNTITFNGWWWVSGNDTLSYGRGRLLSYDAINLVSGYGLKTNGYSVRCMKDN